MRLERSVFLRGLSPLNLSFVKDRSFSKVIFFINHFVESTKLLMKEALYLAINVHVKVQSTHCINKSSEIVVWPYEENFEKYFSRVGTEPEN